MAEIERIIKYEVIEELSSFCEEMKLWLVEDNSGEEFEILTIKSPDKYKIKVDRILKNEIAPLIDSKVSGIQKPIEQGFDDENKCYYILYQNIDKFEEIRNFNKKSLLSILNTLKELKEGNIFGFMLSPETIWINQKNNELALRFIGLYELFTLFKASLPNKDYLSPELQEGKKPKLQHDIFSVGKLFEAYLEEKNEIEIKRILDLENKERYRKYIQFIEDVEKLHEPTQLDPARDTIYVETKLEHKQKLFPIVEEMNDLCYWRLMPKRSEQKKQITGEFATKNYSGIFFVDDENYIFVPWSEKLEGTNDEIKEKGEIARFNFTQEPVSDFDCVSCFEEQFNLNNNLVEQNEKKKSLVKKWKTLPEKEKEFIEEKAFKANYVERKESKSNNVNIVFTLEENTPKKDWEDVKNLKNEGVVLFINDEKIGKILDYNRTDKTIIIKDCKLMLDEIPEEGELRQDVRQETSQFKKQVEACEKLDSRDIVNPEIAGILANPETISGLKRVNLEYDKFEAKIINPKLKGDESQLEAVIEAMNKRPVYLIQGPPGTGKTTVIVELVQQLIREKADCKILITSQSNLAVDNVLERMPDDILFMRLASEHAIGKENISPTIEPHLFERKLESWVEETKKKSEQAMAQKPVKQKLINFLEKYEQQVSSEKDFEKHFYQLLNFQPRYIKNLFEKVNSKNEADKIFAKELGSNFNILRRVQKDWFAFITNASSDDGDKNKKKSMLKNGSTEIDLRTAFAKSTNVIGATCIHIASAKYSNINFKFDYVIMDEASKASPAEAIVPLNMGKNIVLIGDHKQLPPVITREEAVKEKVKKKLEDNGLDFEKEFGESLFESLITGFEDNNELLSYVKMLNIQYRMPRQIGWLISKNFYNSKLKNPDVHIEGLENYDKNKSHGLKFKKAEVEIPGEGKVPSSILFISTSKRDNPYDNDNKYDRNNLCNVEAVKEVLQNLNILYPNNTEKEKFTIGIIAGYRGQVNLLKNKIDLKKYSNFGSKEDNKFSSLIEINTVDKFQGAERDIIIYDLVRSSLGQSNIGFLDDYRRINVAFSRAKRLLIVVGDSEYILKRATLNPKSKFKEFKLQNIVNDLYLEGLIYNSLNEATDD